MTKTHHPETERPLTDKNAITVTRIDVQDIRFPTSLQADGSDAMNHDPDYSVAYLQIHTTSPEEFGCGFTFTLGRGTQICVSAVEAIATPLLDRNIDELTADMGALYRELGNDSQLRWLGPDKGVVHLALAAVMNAVWDLAARRARKPLWRLLADMTPEQLVDAADLSYLDDALTRTQALNLLTAARVGRDERIAELEHVGYPCYTTSAGWLGYSDQKMVSLARVALSQGFRHIKLKVGNNLEDDLRRLALARKTIGPDVHLMADANQVWSVPQAITWATQFAPFNLYWIEEPTHPDDILGHAAIREATGLRVATGEHGMNRILFKQMLQASALDVLQLDSCRLASINEILAVYLLAAHFEVPVCPHAGGVGLCELVSHLVMVDYAVISGTKKDRVAEFVDHLHEHFVDPCLVNDGHYLAPTNPGYSSQMHTATIQQYAYPNGSYWQAHHE